MRTDLATKMHEALVLNEKNKDLLGLDRVRIFEVGHVFPQGKEELNITLGVSGKKSESVLQEALDLIDLNGKSKDGIVEIILDSENLPEYTPISLPAAQGDIYTPFSPYPFIVRDIAVWVPETFSEEDLLDIIVSEAGPLLVRHSLFDRFEKDERVSYGFRLVFQSDEKTLTDEEINKTMASITEELHSEEGVEVR
jgi:phenylalanyl-tRNA synthetase beta subunit